jgi:hypothetical protein
VVNNINKWLAVFTLIPMLPYLPKNRQTQTKRQSPRLPHFAPPAVAPRSAPLAAAPPSYSLPPLKQPVLFRIFPRLFFLIFPRLNSYETTTSFLGNGGKAPALMSDTARKRRFAVGSGFGGFYFWAYKV